MIWIVLGIAVVVILGIIAAAAKRSSWHVLMESGELTEEMSKKYDHLKSAGVRCRIKHQAKPASGTVGVAAGRAYESVRLEVHKDDLGKSEEALEKLRYTPGARF
jgi:hypothetical protein